MQEFRREERTGFEWYNLEATPEQKKLFDRISAFSVLFDDLLFKPGTATHEMMRCQVCNKGEWKNYYLDAPDEIEYFDYSFFTFSVKPLSEDCVGYFFPAEQELCIASAFIGNDAAILHEMIHLHEFVLDCAPSFCHDMAFWGLYTQLRERIPQLDEIISANSFMLTQESVYELGGTHDLLFLLKSFDLDIRKGYPLGTVFAYGKETELKKFTYTKEGTP